jgi:kynurenine formamidase
MRMEHFKAIGERLSNWKRWGAEDQRGTLNFITRERVLAASACIKTGKLFELSIPLGADGPQTGLGGRVNPLHFLTVMPTDDLQLGDGLNISDDFISMPLQGATQWDSLAHVGYDDRFYNDVPVDAVTAMRGATRNGIDQVLPGIVGRGVLVDIPRLRGVPWLETGQSIEPDELESALTAQDVVISPGDILAVRTGWRRKALAEGWGGWMLGNPGLSVACAEWLHGREIAAVVSDNWGIEVQPAAEGQGILPLHCILIRDMGMMLGEIFDLEDLAADCAADGVWDFFLCAPPLRVVGGVGSPVSPVAVK